MMTVEAMLPVHLIGQCKGWLPGPYDQRSMCRLCWTKHNPATVRDPKWVATPNIVEDRQSSPNIAKGRPPCIHLGPIQAPCPLGDKLRDVRHCLCEATESTRCWRSAAVNTDRDVASCERCPHYDPGYVDGVTIAITHWQRPAALARLLASLKRYLPGYPVEVEDTDGNLSAGRNRLYGRVKTRYIVVMEEDFLTGPGLASGLADATSILDKDQAIAGVGGIAHERGRGAVRWGHNFIRRGERCYIVPSARPMRRAKVPYRPCDLVLNFGLFRRSLFDAVPWDSAFPIQEHTEYFWRASRTHEFAFYSGLEIDHLRDRPNGQYIAGRNRDFTGRIFAKHGFRFAADNERPR